MSRKRFMFTGAAVAALLFATVANAADVVKVGISAEPYPPFTYKAPSGKWTGFEIKLQKAICAQAKLSCKTTPTAWAGIIAALDLGKIDAIMNSMTITPEREKKIAFTHPYYQSGLEYVLPNNDKTKVPGGLKGKIVGVQGATQAAAFATKDLGPNGATIKIYDKQGQLSRDLEAGRLDLMVADAVYTRGFVQRHKGFHDVPVTNWPLQHMGIGVRKRDTALREALNKGIVQVLENGTCRKLSMRYLGFDVCAKP